jgi:NADPH:quinone reductase-like Zn-dependent oxidoreductase
VVGLVRRGALAELAAVPTSQLAVLPSTVTAADAATLPTAGLTALQALDLAGAHLAKRVLVTGATGGVGQYAVQLAALGGANVTALVPAWTSRLVTLLAQQKLVDVVELEADWQDVSHAIDALLKRTIPLTKRCPRE